MNGIIRYLGLSTASRAKDSSPLFRNRRHFLSMFAANVSITHRLFVGTGLAWTTTLLGLRQSLAWLRPLPAIDGLLGEHLVAGTTGRLCIFGKNLLDAETIIFPDAMIYAQPLAISDNEIIVDITVPENIGVEKLEFHIKTRTGEVYSGGNVRIILHGSSNYNVTQGISPSPCPGWPGNAPTLTPGWPERHSNAVEQYYNRYYSDRPPVAGIGGNLL
jgi:hypothetical protein